MHNAKIFFKEKTTHLLKIDNNAIQNKRSKYKRRKHEEVTTPKYIKKIQLKFCFLIFIFILMPMVE